MIHQNEKVQQALSQLCDALCTWERDTGIESVLTLREKGGYSFAAISGKPVNADISYKLLLSAIGEGV